MSDEEENVLKKSLKEISQAISKNLNDNLINILVDISRFRLHLKYTRFAHRIFNRMSILTDDGDIELSKQARTLFQLYCADEIEDDAVILSFLEYQHTPQQWFSVARACGLARSMLRIIYSNNKFAKQSELPNLELGIGICFTEEGPRFLFDGEQPIMISSAIGLADRLSSCSWKLREKMESKIFSVEVLAYDEEERDKGEKGQQLIRFNVNGILLENAAFAKLEKEVKLRKISVAFDNHQEKLYYGLYKDVEGSRHDIVIREGRVGLWKDESIIRGDENAEPYYEVVTNGKVISMLRDKLNSK